MNFAETRTIQDNEVRIDYIGKVSGNEIKFTRKVANFATQDFVAKRVPGEPVASAAPTNSASNDQPCQGPGGFSGPIVPHQSGVHAYLKEKEVPHVRHVDGNGHDATHWKNNLWLFAQRIFK